MTNSRIIINDRKVNLIQYGEGENEVVLLHGWGQNIQMMDYIGQRLINSHITILDFPGFGDSEEPKESMNVQEYAEWLAILLESLQIENPILIGHSFGGRVAIKYASMYSVEKVVLLATPCIRHRKKPNLKEKIYKIVKKTPFGEIIRRRVGSPDYNNATPIMRETLVKVVNEDLLEDAKKITAPTLIFAGLNDTAVNIEDTYIQANSMLNAAVIEQNGTHYAYLENIDQTAIVINEFIRPQKHSKDECVKTRCKKK